LFFLALARIGLRVLAPSCGRANTCEYRTIICWLWLARIGMRCVALLGAGVACVVARVRTQIADRAPGFFSMGCNS